MNFLSPRQLHGCCQRLWLLVGGLGPWKCYDVNFTPKNGRQNGTYNVGCHPLSNIIQPQPTSIFFTHLGLHVLLGIWRSHLQLFLRTALGSISPWPPGDVQDGGMENHGETNGDLKKKQKLGGGFNPFEKYSSNWTMSPITQKKLPKTGLLGFFDCDL